MGLLGRIVGQLFLNKFHTDGLSDIDNIVGQFLVEGIETAVCIAYGEIICAMLESVEMLVAESVAVVVHSLLGLGGMKDIGMRVVVVEICIHDVEGVLHQ